jgi:hypothetical protein
MMENLKGRDQLEDLGVYGRIILKWILKKIGCEDVDWICLAEDIVQWRTILSF